MPNAMNHCNPTTSARSSSCGSETDIRASRERVRSYAFSVAGNAIGAKTSGRATFSGRPTARFAAENVCCRRQRRLHHKVHTCRHKNVYVPAREASKNRRQTDTRSTARAVRLQTRTPAAVHFQFNYHKSKWNEDARYPTGVWIFNYTKFKPQSGKNSFALSTSFY